MKKISRNKADKLLTNKNEPYSGVQMLKYSLDTPAQEMQSEVNYHMGIINKHGCYTYSIDHMIVPAVKGSQLSEPYHFYILKYK